MSLFAKIPLLNLIWNSGFNKGLKTGKIQEGIEVKLTEMGDRAKGISWFSSKAADYASESR